MQCRDTTYQTCRRHPGQVPACGCHSRQRLAEEFVEVESIRDRQHRLARSSWRCRSNWNATIEDVTVVETSLAKLLADVCETDRDKSQFEAANGKLCHIYVQKWQ